MSGARVAVGASGYRPAVVEWGSVADERAQAWIDGRITADEYFDEASREAEDRARRTVRRRIVARLADERAAA